jgi:hypothetical protein
MTINELIKEIKDNLHQTDDISVLAEWDNKLSLEYAWVGNQLAEVKRDRAKEELDIQAKLLADGKKPTESGIERAYYATERGAYNAYATQLLKSIGHLIRAVRFKREMMK